MAVELGENGGPIRVELCIDRVERGVELECGSIGLDRRGIVCLFEEGVPVFLGLLDGFRFLHVHGRVQMITYAA